MTWREFFHPWFNERGYFGGSDKKETQATAVTSTTQTKVAPESAEDREQRLAALRAELLRLFYAEKYAADVFQEPLMTASGQEGMKWLNQYYNDVQDERGLTGVNSPILNARGLAQAAYLADLEKISSSKKTGALSYLGTSPGSLGLLGLGQYGRLAGSPTTTSGTTTGTTTGTGSSSGFGLGSLGSLLGGVGSLYAGYKYQPTTGPVGGYGGGYQAPNYSNLYGYGAPYGGVTI